MGFDTHVDSLEGLSEEVAGNYEESSSGGYRLSVNSTDGRDLVDSAGLQNALKAERKAVKDARAKLKTYDGLDPDEARSAIDRIANGEALEGIEDLDAKLAERQAQLESKFDGDRTRLTTKHSEEAAKLQGHIEALTSQLNTELVQSASLKEIAVAGGEPKILLPKLVSAIRVVEDENTGNMVAKVFDDSGQVRLSSKPGSSDDMSIKEYVAELREDEVWSRAFNGSTASGGDSAKPGTATRKTYTISREDARDVSKYRAAQEAAAAAGRDLTMTD